MKYANRVFKKLFFVYKISITSAAIAIHIIIINKIIVDHYYIGVIIKICINITWLRVL